MSAFFIYAARSIRKPSTHRRSKDRTVVSIDGYAVRKRSLDPSMPSTTSNPRIATQLEPEIPVFCTAALRIPAQESYPDEAPYRDECGYAVSPLSFSFSLPLLLFLST